MSRIGAVLRLCSIALCALLCAGAPALAETDEVKEFYRDRTVTLYVGFDAGGGYDAYARVLARHIGRHVPGGPTVVVKNMPGAGSLKLMNYLAAAAPRDGSVFGTVNRSVVTQPLLQPEGVAFEALAMSWIGSVTDEVSVCASWHTAPVKRWEDLQSQELIVGSTGPGADSDVYPRVLNRVLGAKFKVIAGYPGGEDVLLALQRGEVAGRCGWSVTSLLSSHADWLREGKITILAQLGLEAHPAIPEVPLLMELAQSEEQRDILRLVFAPQQIARPFVAPPALPSDRLAALRAAFMATMADPDFRAEMERRELDVNPASGAEVEAFLREIYATSPSIVEEAAAALRPE